MSVNETYLGDAVFVSYDWHMLKLRTGDGGSQVIYLEPAVYRNLVEYVASLNKPAPSPPPFNPDDTTATYEEEPI
jgi:hypothetical protein